MKISKIEDTTGRVVSEATTTRIISKSADY